ncbi:MAG: hypothetical protein DYG87_09525 [Anaerolineae bacterium CFX3]|jgi:hypothetical protein|nr:hypothetical protein [Anaerolineales bacterium]MCC7512293.1 hypothetical protein [Anaerolineae bacterium]MCE7906024.1 hypothetical protein [Anaerolineae bacterium CFX3]OQY85167.1 MAG: hypothetical protein B6D40_04110 [Anaerolineae bacterium UTCFX3]GER80243.1 conserved hypothetical protein [Candidatus Denitrolinea symbiosum]
MTKSLNKWLRKIHRWIAVPTAITIPFGITFKLLGDPELMALWKKWDVVQSPLILTLAITGGYLYLLPYIVKGQRKRKNRQGEMAVR